MDKLLSLQQRRHDELTDALAKVAGQRDDVILKLVKLDTKLRDLQRRVGRSGRRLAETREAFAEAKRLAKETKRAKAAADPAPPQEGDGLADVLPIAAADKAAKLREEMRGERMRKRG